MNSLTVCLQSFINWSNDKVVSEQIPRCGEKKTRKLFLNLRIWARGLLGNE